MSAKICTPALEKEAEVGANKAANMTTTPDDKEEEINTSSSASTIVPLGEEEMNGGMIVIGYFFQVPSVKWHPQLEMMSKSGLSQGQYERKVLAQGYVDGSSSRLIATTPSSFMSSSSCARDDRLHILIVLHHSSIHVEQLVRASSDMNLFAPSPTPSYPVQLLSLAIPRSPVLPAKLQVMPQSKLYTDIAFAQVPPFRRDRRIHQHRLPRYAYGCQPNLPCPPLCSHALSCPGHLLCISRLPPRLQDESSLHERSRHLL